MAERTWRWVEDVRESQGMPIRVLAPEGRRSPTVTCITLPDGLKGPDVVAGVKARGWVIGGGYGKLKDSSIRIGHMGDHTVEEVDALLAELEGVLA
jgi:aspartate aminotransferase-like enzyme